MFGLVSKLKYDVVVEQRNTARQRAEAASVSRDLWRKTAQTAGKALNEMVEERDDLRRQLDAANARVRTGNGNLRQFRSPTALNAG